MIQAPRFEPVEYEIDSGPLNAATDIELSLYQDPAQRRKGGYANTHSDSMSEPLCLELKETSVEAIAQITV